MLYRQTFPVGALQCNCTIIADGAAKEAVVIDPGAEIPRILDMLATEGFKLRGIVHTHAHIDHIGGATELARATGAATYLHPGDTFLYDVLPLQAQLLGLPPPGQADAITNTLGDDMTVPFGALELGVLHTPGHTPGSVCFHVSGHDLCFAGDTLFKGGIGRTDLPGGDSTAITRSIRERLYSLNGSVEVICGHGAATTIDRERRSNPYVRA